MAAVSDLPLTPASESIHIGPAVLLDPENVGVVFGIFLLSCIEVEIYVMVYVHTSSLWRQSLYKVTSHLFREYPHYIFPPRCWTPKMEGLL